MHLLLKGLFLNYYLYFSKTRTSALSSCINCLSVFSISYILKAIKLNEEGFTKIVFSFLKILRLLICLRTGEFCGVELNEVGRYNASETAL
jgi:hypothetical protein